VASTIQQLYANVIGHRSARCIGRLGASVGSVHRGRLGASVGSGHRSARGSQIVLLVDDRSSSALGLATYIARDDVV
jgi:hypothetical protein